MEKKLTKKSKYLKKFKLLRIKTGMNKTQTSFHPGYYYLIVSIFIRFVFPD